MSDDKRIISTVDKGGQNVDFQFTKRPPDPVPLFPNGNTPTNVDNNPRNNS